MRGSLLWEEHSRYKGYTVQKPKGSWKRAGQQLDWDGGCEGFAEISGRPEMEGGSDAGCFRGLLGDIQLGFEHVGEAWQSGAEEQVCD